MTMSGCCAGGLLRLIIVDVGAWDAATSVLLGLLLGLNKLVFEGHLARLLV